MKNKFSKKIFELSCNEFPIQKELEMPLEMKKRITDRIYDNKKRNLFFPKRAVALVAIVCIFSTSCTIYAFNEDVRETVNTGVQSIKNFFTREHVLIDNNSVSVEKEVISGNIKFRLGKVARDENTHYFYCDFELLEGTFEGTALVYDTLTLERKTGKKWNKLKEIHMGEAGLMAGEMICIFDEKITDRVRYVFPANINDTDSEIFRIVLKGVKTLDEKAVTKKIYSDEMNLEFSMDEVSFSLPVSEYELNRTFDLQGHSIILEKIRISPVEVVLTFDNSASEQFTFPATGKHLWSSGNYITGFFDFFERESSIPKVVLDELNKYSYRACISFKGRVSSSKLPSGTPSFTPDMDKIKVIFELTSPIYEEDIEKITLEREDGLFHGAEGETIILWNNTDETSE